MPRSRRGHGLAAALAAVAAAARLARGVPPAELVKGISYSPMPCRGPCSPPQDDFMSEATKPLWGRRGRGDLRVISQLGANNVRLYGNNPENDHRGFLDEARAWGLSVTAGISDYPYYQAPENCRGNGDDCYTLLKDAYLQNLQAGFLESGGGGYHPALRAIIVMNEPDLKYGLDYVAMGRALVSAIDGMIDAEKEAGLTSDDHLVNFTATFSFGICGVFCGPHGGLPALGQMDFLRHAVHSPGDVGYAPRNDLREFFRTRWVSSFNTANPARDIQRLFLNEYEATFASTPVVIQEFHHPQWDIDLDQILGISLGSNLLQGASFFEFQVRYDKGGSETEFGMFGLGDYSVAEFDFFGMPSAAWCLTPAYAIGARGRTMLEAVAAQMGGIGLDSASLCEPHPSAIPLTAAGLGQLRARHDFLASPALAAAFLARLVRHLGGRVRDVGGLLALAGHAMHGAMGLDEILNRLRTQSSWASWSPNPICSVDRLAFTNTVAQAIAYVCGAALKYNCSLLGDPINQSIWTLGDYVFGRHFEENGGNPFETCYFDGAATLAEPQLALDPQTLIPQDLGDAAGSTRASSTPRTTARTTAITSTPATTELPIQGTTSARPTTVDAASSTTFSTTSVHQARVPTEPERFLFVLVVENVDFNGLSTHLDLRSAFEAMIKRTVATEFGDPITSRGVRVILSAGSVLVHVAVAVPTGISVGDLRARFGSGVELFETVEAGLESLAGLGAVVTGNISVTAAPAGPPQSDIPDPGTPAADRRPGGGAAETQGQGATEEETSGMGIIAGLAGGGAAAFVLLAVWVLSARRLRERRRSQDNLVSGLALYRRWLRCGAPAPLPKQQQDAEVSPPAVAEVAVSVAEAMAGESPDPKQSFREQSKNSEDIRRQTSVGGSSGTPDDAADPEDPQALTTHKSRNPASASQAKNAVAKARG